MSDLQAMAVSRRERRFHPAQEALRLASGFLALCLALVVFAGALRAQDNSYAPTKADRQNLLEAIARETPAFRPAKAVTGITVPHHLLAADLIARGFWAASAGSYDRIILIAPDHFHRISSGFATTADIPDTILGPVHADRQAIAQLLENETLFAPFSDLSAEHGISALLPFIAHFFPDAKIIPVIASVRGGPETWQKVLPHLDALVDDRTLVIQSTDFSHFLPLGEAIARDQQTLNVLATNDPERSRLLWQPDHLDSSAALYLQLALQGRQGAQHVVIANRSSADFGGNRQEVTTYLTLVWHRDPVALSGFDYPDQERMFIAGDTLLGRGYTRHLSHDRVLSPLLETVRQATRGAPVVLNLEGVLLDAEIANVGEDAHVMTRTRAAPVLQGLNVVGASLANNHSWDFGAPGVEETRTTLDQLKVETLEHGQVRRFGGVSIATINLITGRDPHTGIEQLEEVLCALDGQPPLIGFLHWGTEYTPMPANQEHAIADIAQRCGFTALIGAHSHQASSEVSYSPTGLPFVFSVGNFFFDQSAARSSGSLVELRRFGQGTLALRIVPLPHLFSMGWAIEPARGISP